MLLEISNQYKSPNFDNRRKKTKIKYIIIHYTETTNLESALQILCDPKKKVSCHFVIDLDGTIYRLVDESQNAWHAGISCWKKDTNLNEISLGIEVVNNGNTKFNTVQVEYLIKLLKKLTKDFDINFFDILGHSDIAPTRKIDPGIFFPWDKLWNYKLGLPVKNIKTKKYINLNEKQLILFLRNLKKIGFSQINLSKKDSQINGFIIDSFHRHFFIKQLGSKPNNISLRIADFLVSNLQK